MTMIMKVPFLLSICIMVFFGLIMIEGRTDFTSHINIALPSEVVIHDDELTDQRPAELIRGRNGLCVDVSDGTYNDGNSIVIRTCRDDQPTQQWTFNIDGTIRSNGKCITTYGFSSGSYVMIYDCAKAVRDATKWKRWSNGTIVNPRSGLVLSATSGNTGTTLTVETNTYGSSQAWLVSNDNTLPVRHIVGLNDLCLYTDKNGVWLEKCASVQSVKWLLYPDGTIRTQLDSDLCVQSRESDKLVVVSSCTGSKGERWAFVDDGTIKNLYYDMVMDVCQADPSLKQIVLYWVNGNPNQFWYLI